MLQSTLQPPPIVEMVGTTIPPYCKAICYRRRGAPADVLEVNQKYPVPRAVPKGYVLVKVAAVALNPVDWKLMTLLPSLWGSKVVASDYSGTVVKVHASEARLHVDDEVYGVVQVPYKLAYGMGSLAQYILCPTNTCARRPQKVDRIDAAGLSLVASTALIMTHHLDRLGRHKVDQPRVLVCGGSSGVGLMAIPILQHKGCTVIATCSAAKAELVRGRGATDTVDYRQDDFHQQLMRHVQAHGRFDLILDCVESFDVWQLSPQITDSHSAYVSVGHDTSDGQLAAMRRMLSYMVWPSWLGGVATRYRRPPGLIDRTTMQELEQLVQDGIVTPVTDSRFSFDQAKEAFARLQTNRAQGKVLIVME